MRLLDKIYNEYRSMDPVNKREQYKLLLEPIFCVIAIIAFIVSIIWLSQVVSNAAYMPEGMHPLTWYFKGQPLSGEYNSWAVSSNDALEGLLSGSISWSECGKTIVNMTSAIDVAQWCVLIAIPIVVSAAIIGGAYLFALFIIGSFLELKWALKDYDDIQKFEYDRYRFILAIDYCCRGVDVDQVGIQLVDGASLQPDYFKGLNEYVDQDGEAERKHKIYKAVYERMEYSIGKPQYSVRTFDNSAMFSTLSISSFSIVLATITLIITMTREGWSLVAVAASLLVSFIISRFISFVLRRRVRQSQKYQNKSLEKNITEIEYLKKLLEDVVYFNAPVIVCDIEGRIDEWKRRKAEEETAEIPVWHNKSAEEFKYFKRIGKAFLLGTGTKPKNESEKGEDCKQDGNRKK